MHSLLIIARNQQRAWSLPSFNCEQVSASDAFARLDAGQHDCVLLLSEGALDETELAVHQFCDTNAIPILLGAAPSRPQTAQVLDQRLFDGFIDPDWDPRVISRCLKMAVERAQVGRNVIDIQRQVLEVVRGEVESLEDLATKDDLTRLHNLRHFRLVLEKEHQRCQRYHHSYSLVFLDADNLKEVNTRFGHSAGAKVLCEIGEAIASVTRKSDFAFRVGGDEFVVLLVETSTAGARAYAELLRKRVNERIQLLGFSPVTISAGIASHPEHGESSSEILTHADQALYRAKELGKDRVECFGA